MDIGTGELVGVAFVYHTREVSEMLADCGGTLSHDERVLIDHILEEPSVALDILEERLEFQSDFSLFLRGSLLLSIVVLCNDEQPRVSAR